MSIGNWVTVRVPSSETYFLLLASFISQQQTQELTHIQASHECELPINNAQLLVMSPEQRNVVLRSVQCGQGILREFSQAECAHLHLGAKIGQDISASWDVVRMSEDLDVLVKTFQMFSRVLDYVHG